MKKFLSFLLCFALLGAMVIPCQAADTIYGMTDQPPFIASDETELPYRFYKPEGDAPENGYAVYIHLHGIGECGNDNKDQLSVGVELVRAVLNQRTDTIVIVPQSMVPWVNVSPTRGTYAIDSVPPTPYLVAVMELLAHLQNTYKIDANRLYVSGLSMGGYGTWDLLARYPNTFAAAIPVCGGGDPTMAKRMTNVAIRTYHSADDPTVPVAGTRAMVAAIQEAGGNISYTEYDDLGHGCWSRAFSTADQVSSLFSQRKQADIPVEPICPLGDVDENGSVDAADALVVLKSVVGHIYLIYSQTLAADVDQNGVVSAADALMILQVVVGKIPPFNQ